jgi:hypothetical protein
MEKPRDRMWAIFEEEFSPHFWLRPIGMWWRRTAGTSGANMSIKADVPATGIRRPKVRLVTLSSSNLEKRTAAASPLLLPCDLERRQQTELSHSRSAARTAAAAITGHSKTADSNVRCTFVCRHLVIMGRLVVRERLLPPMAGR